MIDKNPQMEADLIVSGAYHKYASRWIAQIVAATREGDVEWETLKSVKNLTEENWEKALHDHYSLFGVIQEVILHLLMDGLEDHEQLFIKNCWKLPKWRRPRWLKEMEKDSEFKHR
ncbi:MAG: hypothetical protein KAW83_00190 [Dehalococcoidia bacterium]|nr:hypothetical protein [Dehalococcoidia bacterium]